MELKVRRVIVFNRILASLNVFHTDNNFENLNNDPSSEVINHPQSPNVLVNKFYEDAHEIIKKGVENSRNRPSLDPKKINQELDEYFKQLEEKY